MIDFEYTREVIGMGNKEDGVRREEIPRGDGRLVYRDTYLKRLPYLKNNTGHVQAYEEEQNK